MTTLPCFPSGLWRRLAVVTALALSLFVPAKLQPAGAQAPAPPIRVGLGPNDQALPILYAAEAGLYRRAGLNVEVSRQAGTAVISAAIAGGSLDVGQGSTLGAVVAIAKGLPITLIGNLAYANADRPDVGLLVSTNSPIKTPKDLEGKTLAAVSLQDMNSIATILWLQQRGVDTSTLKYLEIPASASLAAIEQDRIQASTVFEPFYTAFLATGKVRTLGNPYDAIGRHWSNTVMFANEKWANENKALVERFLRATLDGATYVSAHEDETAAIMAKFTGIDVAVMRQVRHGERGVPISAADVQPTIDAAFKFKVIPKTFSAAEFICSCALRK
jgi:NitT/TauT family transport system substrate-binding protein